MAHKPEDNMVQRTFWIEKDEWEAYKEFLKSKEKSASDRIREMITLDMRGVIPIKV